MESAKNITTMLALIALSCIVVPDFMYPQDEAGQLFEKGLYLEESQGDLEGAISLYERVVKNSKAERDIAAKAQLHIGMCYEKLGQREARLAYQKVVDNYPQQQQEVASARRRLASLSKTSDADKKPVFTTRQILAGFMPWAGSLSPDGRYALFGELGTEQLAVGDLETGVTRRLTNIGGGGDPLSSRWSPDGKYIAFVWDTGPYGDLRVISAEGGKSRILVDFDRDSWPEVFDWTPDSKKILICVEREEDGTRQIVLVSASDGASTVLKTFKGRGGSPQVMRFSRDGQYIAYDYPQEKGAPERDIFVISTDGKREFPLLQHPADDCLLGWPPNGESILFTSNRTGSLDMWIQTVSGAKAQGSPALIKRGVDGIKPIGFTQDGDFYYRLLQLMSNVYSTRMDFVSGKVLAPPEIIVKRNEGRNSWPDYSADGKYLAYLTTRSRSFGNDGTLVSPSLNILCIRSLESGKELEFSTGFKQLAGTQWSPDGQSLYLTAWDDQGAGIYRVDAQTGEFTPIVSKNFPSYLPIRCHEVTPDGKTIIYQRLDKTPGHALIIARNLITGEEKQLYSGMFPVFSISPDGQWLALRSGYSNKILQIMPLSGGEPKELLKFAGTPHDVAASIEWTPDGKYILFQRLHDRTQVALWRIAVDGRELQKLNLLTGVFRGLSAQSDGQHLVFSAESSTQGERTIWVMENFFPPEPGASPPAASASEERPNPFVGTWVLNLDKSSNNNPVKSMIVKVEAQDNGLKITRDHVTVGGVSTHFEMAAKFDGKDYPLFGTVNVTTSLRRINANSFELVNKIDGEETSGGVNVVSEDGMTWTQTVKTENLKGEEVTFIFVYDKQED